MSRSAEPGARLDRELVARGLARSRGQAQELIAAGRVWLNGRLADRPAARVGDGDEVFAAVDPYVSRAADKLAGALDDLTLVPSGRALDAGASTGGFTQVLLERGCARVYAVDVGHDQLAPELRDDRRVVVRERTNLRDLTLADVEGKPVDLVVADVSFISLRLLLARLVSVVHPDGWLLALVKPQFEVGRERLGPGGVVREPELWRSAVAAVLAEAAALGWPASVVTPSRRPGPAGNREFFVLLRSDPPAIAPDLDALLRA